MNGKWTARAVLLAVLAAAWMAWPNIGTHPSQKIEPDRWIVSSTANYKGHPTQQPDTVECSVAGVVPGPTKIITYAAWRELELGDTCPEGDR